MAKENKGRGQTQRDQNRGMQKPHEVYDAQGNLVEGGMTQEQWKNRDKSAGLYRPDDAVAVPQAPLEEVEGTEGGDGEANG